MPVPTAAELLATQIRHAWINSGCVLEGLTDEEYFWEPAPGAWSVRARALAGEGTPGVINGFGRGEFVCEDVWPRPERVPVTTIAWRVVHLAAWNDIYIDWTFGSATRTLADVEVPGTCAEGMAWLAEAQERFAVAVEALSDEEVFGHRPAHWGEHLPVARLVSLMINENVHHIAEIGALRDIHRGHARTQPLPPPSLGPDWWQPRAR